MLRLTVSLLFLALLVLGVWTFFDSTTFLFGPARPDYPWWWPSEVSTFGERIDGLFRWISFLLLVFFVLTEGLLVWFVFKYAKKLPGKGIFTHGHHKLEMLWTGIPALLLVAIAVTQLSTFADIKFPSAMKDVPPIADVFASQFDWRFRYPGPDGRAGTSDDLESPFEFVVPAGEKVVFNLRSRDVLHSFFVPKLRVKQDAVPGMTIPVWFEVDQQEFDAEKDPETGELELDLICAELCGWGHYKMAGRVRVVSREAYDEWIETATAAKYTNGQVEESAK